MTHRQATAAEQPDELPSGFIGPDGEEMMAVEYVADTAQAESHLPSVSLSMVFRHGHQILWHPVHGEVVVHRPDTGISYVLNPISALAWQCLDGESTLGEILADIADAFELEPGAAERDFSSVFAKWLALKLIEEVQHG